MRKLLIILLLVLMGACTAKPLTDTDRYVKMRATLAKIPSFYPFQDATSDHYLVNLATPPYIMNKPTLVSFTEKIAKGLSAELLVVTYTDEGDPILTIVQYDGKAFLAIRDTTRDKFGPKTIEEFKFKKWIMFKENNRTSYHLFHTDVTYAQYQKSMYSSNSADWIDHLTICYK